MADVAEVVAAPEPVTAPAAPEAVDSPAAAADDEQLSRLLDEPAIDAEPVKPKEPAAEDNAGSVEEPAATEPDAAAEDTSGEFSADTVSRLLDLGVEESDIKEFPSEAFALKWAASQERKLVQAGKPVEPEKPQAQPEAKPKAEDGDYQHLPEEYGEELRGLTQRYANDIKALRDELQQVQQANKQMAQDRWVERFDSEIAGLGDDRYGKGGMHDLHVNSNAFKARAALEAEVSALSEAYQRRGVRVPLKDIIARAHTNLYPTDPKATEAKIQEKIVSDLQNRQAAFRQKAARNQPASPTRTKAEERAIDASATQLAAEAGPARHSEEMVSVFDEE